MVEKIKKYLSQDDRDYDEGLILLSKASKNRILIQNLGRKQFSAKLDYELIKVVDRYEAANATPVIEPSKDENQHKDPQEDEDINDSDIPVIKEVGRVRVIREGQNVNYDDLPEELKKKWDENAEAYKEARSLHEKLKLMEKAKAEDRAPLVSRLVELSHIVRSNWDVIDSWDPKSDKSKTSDKPDQKIDHKRIQANRKYISINLKKYEDKPDDKLKSSIQQRISELVTAGEKFKNTERLVKLGFEF